MNREEAIKIVKSHYPANKQMLNEALEFLIPELKVSEDERVRKVLVDYFKRYKGQEERGGSTMFCGIPTDDILTWLEKQGEQKPTDKIHLGKEYKCIASPRYSTFMRGEIYKPEDKFLCSFMNFCSDCFEPIEDSEQSDFTSNANKVEPKFHEGEWVVSPMGVYWHIDKISNNRYEVTSNTGASTDWPLNTKLYHRFTIQDAEDGDIIYATSKFNTFDFIYIFSELKDKNPWVYCSVDSDVLDGDLKHWYFDYCKGSIELDRYNFYPASKEQRDLLFQKMKEAGYEWDSKQKKLKQLKKK